MSESIELRTLRENIGDRDRALLKLEARLTKKDELISELEVTVSERDAKIAKLEGHFAAGREAREK